MKDKSVMPLIVISLIILLNGCAAFRSEIEGRYTKAGQNDSSAVKVSVLFIISHYHQATGYDAIPKLENKYQIVKGFDDLFIDALPELTNINRYSVYTEFASDVSDSRRRAEKDSMIAGHDYVIRMKFMKEHSFAGYFLGTLVSTLSATVLPYKYSTHYSLVAEVYNREGRLTGSFTRRASLSKWVESLLIVIYPFHPEKRKEEEIYREFMHDVFHQIDREHVIDLTGGFRNP